MEVIVVVNLENLEKRKSKATVIESEEEEKEEEDYFNEVNLSML